MTVSPPHLKAILREVQDAANSDGPWPSAQTRTIWPWAAMTITRTGQRSDKKLPDVKKQRRRRRGRPSRRRNQGRPSGCRMKPLPVSATEIMSLARLAGEEVPGSRVWISRLGNLYSRASTFLVNRVQCEACNFPGLQPGTGGRDEVKSQQIL